MPLAQERDFPPGHPKAADFHPASAEAKEWARKNVHPLGERDFPVDHPKAIDTPGNLNHVAWAAGVDPFNPQLEPFTGRPPDLARAAAAEAARAAHAAVETPVREPLDQGRANDALAAKRKELGVEALTMDETMAVLADLERPGAH